MSKSFEELIAKKMHTSWHIPTHKLHKTDEFYKLVDKWDRRYDVNKSKFYPAKEDVFNFLTQDLNNVKVVIVGQDPYATKNHATGHAFETQRKIIPRSLKNILQEVRNDTGATMRQTGSLKKWREQGVLLMNVGLSVMEGRPGFYKKDWMWYTDEIFKILAEQKQHLVWMAWGENAKEKTQWAKDGQLVLTAAHPSPMFAYKGFFGCKHFSQANDYLVRNGLHKIDWGN